MNPKTNSIIELGVTDRQDVDQLFERLTSLKTERGIPALELSGSDGSTLVLGLIDRGAVLSWVSPLGETFHSVGTGSPEGTAVFDYFGSLTEVPCEFVVSRAVAIEAACAYVGTGTPMVDGLSLEPD